MMPVAKQYKDREGRNYLHIFPKNKVTAVFTFDGKNYKMKGTPKFVLRKGKSKFGDEIYFEFKVDETEEVYNTDSKHNCFETYFPQEEGLKLLKSSVDYFEMVKSGKWELL